MRKWGKLTQISTRILGFRPSFEHETSKIQSTIDRSFDFFFLWWCFKGPYAGKNSVKVNGNKLDSRKRRSYINDII